MKVRITESVAGVEFSFAAGQEIDLPKDQAEAMIACGHAVRCATSSKASAALDDARKRSSPRGTQKASK